MSEWLNIETAPKDGTLLRVKGDSGPYGVTYWEGVAKWFTPVNWSHRRATWSDDSDAVLRLAGYFPTHWKPLSEPPRPRLSSGAGGTQ